MAPRYSGGGAAVARRCDEGAPPGTSVVKMKRRRWKPAWPPRRCGDEIPLRRGGESGAATTGGRRRKKMGTKDESRQKEENVGPQPGRV